MHVKVKKGLDIPVAGRPAGPPQHLPAPRYVALNLDPFDTIRFKVHVKAGESVKIGQPLVESKAVPGQLFVSPAGGVVKEIRRGLKRRLLDLIIEVDEKEQYQENGPLDLNAASREEILAVFMRTGMFPHIRLRPFNLVPDPQYVPRDIFVTAVETKPFVPSYELQLEGHTDYFQPGLDALAKLTTGRVHLVVPSQTTLPSFINAQNVEIHTVEGPHPAGTSSLHIHKIAPISSVNDYVWSLSALDVLVIGKMVKEGRYFTDRVISIAGEGVIEGRRGYFYGRMGYLIKDLITDRITNRLLRFISGDPLTGVKAEAADFLGFSHTCFSVIPESIKRQPFHFLRAGLNKFTATRTYFTGHVPAPKKGFSFTTNQHGEERAFIDGSVYEKVMPMRIPTMHLIKALIAEDFELAQQLGLLEVVPEDFALASFICPSKIDMMSIVKFGLHRYSQEVH